MSLRTGQDRACLITMFSLHPARILFSLSVSRTSELVDAKELEDLSSKLRIIMEGNLFLSQGEHALLLKNMRSSLDAFPLGIAVTTALAREEGDAPRGLPVGGATCRSSSFLLWKTSRAKSPKGSTGMGLPLPMLVTSCGHCHQPAFGFSLSPAVTCPLAQLLTSCFPCDLCWSYLPRVQRVCTVARRKA